MGLLRNLLRNPYCSISIAKCEIKLQQISTYFLGYHTLSNGKRVSLLIFPIKTLKGKAPSSQFLEILKKTVRAKLSKIVKLAILE